MEKQDCCKHQFGETTVEWPCPCKCHTPPVTEEGEVEKAFDLLIERLMDKEVPLHQRLKLSCQVRDLLDEVFQPHADSEGKCCEECVDNDFFSSTQCKQQHDCPCHKANLASEQPSEEEVEFAEQFLNPGFPHVHNVIDDSDPHGWYFTAKFIRHIRKLVTQAHNEGAEAEADEQSRTLALQREEMVKDKREALAELEHDQWIAWSKDIAKTETITPARLERWKVLWRPYSELTEAEKDQDREWADRAIEKIKSLST